MKNKFLQDVDGPTFHHFSNGPSLNRIAVFQDHVGGKRGSYVFIKFIDIGFFLKQIRLYGLNESSNTFKNNLIFSSESSERITE